MESKHIDYLNEEMKIIESNSDSDTPEIVEEYMEPIKHIVEIFEKFGHSGSSAPWHATVLSDTIKKMLLYQPMSPINGGPFEWVEVGDDLFQNNRDSAVFEDKTGTHYLDAIVWQGEEDYDTFTGTVQGVSSSQGIKFPFTPKTFYIDVIDVDGEHRIKDWSQLEEVKKYYEFKYENPIEESEEYDEPNPAHFCFGCNEYLGFRGFCSQKCHNDYYDDMCSDFDPDVETLEILSDDELMAGIRRSVREIENGEAIPLSELYMGNKRIKNIAWGNEYD